jgi:hypothetical protein
MNTFEKGVVTHHTVLAGECIMTSTKNNSLIPQFWGAHGSIVVNALTTSRKVASSRPDEVNFSIHLILLAALGPGVHSTSNRNEYQKQKNNNVSGEQTVAGA